MGGKGNSVLLSSIGRFAVSSANRLRQMVRLELPSEKDMRTGGCHEWEFHCDSEDKHSLPAPFESGSEIPDVGA